MLRGGIQAEVERFVCVVFVFRGFEMKCEGLCGRRWGKQEGISLTVKWLCSGVLKLSAKDCVGEGEGRVGEIWVNVTGLTNILG
jgi:hypothetical protein